MSCSVGEMPGGCRLRGASTVSHAAGTTVGIPAVSNDAGSNTASIASHTGTGNARRAPNGRPCCLCWCCCCSCSCLAITQNGEAGNNEPTRRVYDPATSALFNCDNEPIPTLDDVTAWGTSFENLMKCAAGRVLFREFLRFEYSEENVLFWAACEELKREVSPEAVEERARAIYEEYISVLSPKEVSLDSAVRDIVNKNMMQPTPHTYDEAQQQIYTLMQRDSYPRFVTSSIYKNLLEKTKLQHQQASGGNGNNQKPPSEGGEDVQQSPKDDTKMLGHRSSS